MTVPLRLLRTTSRVPFALTQPSTVALLALVVVVENAARLSVPLLVQRGIDHAIPPLLARFAGAARTRLAGRARRTFDWDDYAGRLAALACASRLARVASRGA